MPFVLTDAEVTALGEGRALVRAAILPPPALDACRTEAETLDRAGRLHPAGTGQTATLQSTTRGDRIAWLEPDMPEAPTLASLWTIFESLRGLLNRELWLGLRRFELQLACYPPLARYVRHQDAFRSDPRRRMTAILYLNPPDWGAEDGGLLEIWEDPSAAIPSRVLLPRGGDLVLFRSDALPHAVTPTRRPRWAATAWYRSDDGER